MDKWEEICERIQRSLLAREPDAVLAAGLQLFAEFGRTLELLGEDVNRLANAAEGLLAVATKTAEPEAG